MEPNDRPYIDPATEPGDAGTEEWADAPASPGEREASGPLADPVRAASADDGVIDDSPADTFINDPNAIDERPEGRSPD